MVVMTLLALIVIALMGVFGSTQTAFRASLTQTDVLESGRATMDLITSDLRTMSPSYGVSNSDLSAGSPLNTGQIPVNFSAIVSPNQFGSQPGPLVQSLVASVSGSGRTNVLETIFILSRENQTWTGTGYFVDTASANGINPLYRFSMSTNVSAVNGAAMIYHTFQNSSLSSSPPWSRLMDGVVTLRMRAYDRDGVLMTNGYFNQRIPIKNVGFYAPALGEVGFHMFSNALPAAVEIELATLEDRTLLRAASRPAGSTLQSNYLANQAGNVHVFRQRVAIPNVDPAAYQ
jgi:hypothetical protein